MPRIKTIRDLDLTGRRVLVRVDFNVPIDEAGRVTDTTRIDAALPTLRHLLERDARVALLSHLGRPKGKRDPKYSLRPAAAVLAQALGRPVTFLEDCVGPEVEAGLQALEPGSIALLENVRFHPGEEKNDLELARAMARLGEIYVNDAFGSAHRAHASTEGVTRFLKPAVAGLLMERELQFLGEKTADPARPFVVILGGAKVSDKIGVINRLLEIADTILIGGAMAYTFALARGLSVGKSLCEPDKVDLAKAALEKARARAIKFLLPVDNLIVESLDFKAGTVGATDYTREGEGIPEGWEGVDIGPKTQEIFAREISGAGTVLWNGPMGIFEIEACSSGTFAVARAVAANRHSVTIVGGGDSVTAVNQAGVADAISFISTGGGASLEFLEGKVLPGVAALDAV
jgi:phosphoglycerate kinase